MPGIFFRSGFPAKELLADRVTTPSIVPMDRKNI